MSSIAEHELGPRCPLPNTSLHEQLLAQCRARPHAIAVVCDDEILTYADLGQQAARWADHLVASGARPGGRIGVLLPRNRDLVPALIGILQTGSAYVPLDPAYPIDWIRYAARDAAIDLLVAGDCTPPKIVPDSGMIVRSPDLRPLPWQYLVDPAEVTAQAPAYLIYTSGTSGRPKGVTITHGNAVNFTNWARRSHTIEELSCVLAGTSICFDLSIFEIFATLSAGGTVVLVKDYLAIVDDAPSHNPALLNTVPSVAAELVRFDAIPRSVRTVNLAGEPLHADLLESLWRLPHITKVRNLYGPTETTTYSTVSEVRRGERRPSVGRPIDNTQVFVLDPAGQRVGPGVEGEIFIAGAGVAAGYWNRPDLTAERFCESPFDRTWPVLYRTGDVGAWRDDGELECLGRSDDQVKIRGVRVELTEIEMRLKRLHGVLDAAVVACSFGPYDRRLVAYVVNGTAGPSPLPERLRAALIREVPEALVPTSWQVVDHLPRLANGKIDRRRLVDGWPQKPASTVGSAVSESRAAQIAHEMARVVGLPSMDTGANFFSLGGDSLRAAQIVAKLRELFGCNVPIAALLRHPTAELLAHAIEHRAADLDSNASVSSRVGDAVPLSLPQQQLALFHRLNPGASVHNIGIMLRWRKLCDETELRARCTAVMLRHVPLRSAGIAENAIWRSEASCAPVQRIEAAKFSSEELRALATEEVDRPFDLTSGPPWRILLLERGNEPPWVVLCFHQIVVDQSTLATLLSELNVPSAGHCIPLADRMRRSLVRYRDAVAALGAKSDPSASRYWQDVFRQPAADTSLPVYRPRTGAINFTANRTRRSFPPHFVARIEAVARQETTTPYIVVLCGLVEAMFRWSGSDDIVVGSAFSLRDADALLHDLAGFFASALPLRIPLFPNDRRRDLLRRVHDIALAAHQHKHCPPDLIQAATIGADFTRSASPIPVFFGFMPPVGRDGLSPADAEFEAEELLTEHIEGDVHLQVRWSPQGASAVLDGRADLFDDKTIEILAEHWIEALVALSSAIEAPLVRSAVRSGSAHTHAVSGSVFDCFARTADRDPGHIAICSAGHSLTYADLYSDALTIAAQLSATQRSGACGLLFEDQALATSAALACLHRGRTFVPLGRALPAAGGARVSVGNVVRGGFASAMGIEIVLTDQPMREAAAALLPNAMVATVSHERRHGSNVGEPVEANASLAYVLSTSGTTGPAKGVAQSQRNLLHHATTYADSIRLGPNDRVSLLTTIEFDAAMMDIFGALLSGASLHVWSLRRRGFAGLAEWIETEAITVLHCTPSVFRALAGISPQLGNYVRSVRCLALGGEPAGRRDLLEFEKVFAADCVLVNGFGPTESTTATQAFFNRGNDHYRALLPIGRPVRGTDISLIGLEAGRPGSVGEIVIRSPFVSPGYVTSAADLARLGELERSCREDQIREYKTGDLARILPNGELLHVGRKDDQVKISGVRSAFTEIEHAVMACSGDIAEAVVVADAPDRLRGPLLTAFLLPREGRAVDVDRIRDVLRFNLPPHLLPNRMLVLGRLPYLANGKVNRRALKKLAHRRAYRAAAEPAAPETEQWENIIGKLWAKVLRLPSQPASTDTFLALGGRSLDALVVLERLRRDFAITVPASALLGPNTLRHAARLAAAAAQSSGPANDVRPYPEAEHLERQLAPQQRPFWFAEQTSPGGAANRVILALDLGGRASRPAVAGVLTTLVSRHRVLRSRTVLDGTAAMVAIDDPVAPKIAWIERPSVEVPVILKRLPDKFTRAFDLEREWPVRALGISTPATDVLVLLFHHIAVDAWSVSVLAEEFRTLYDSALGETLANPSDTLLAIPPTYSAAIARLRDRLTSHEEKRQLAYWWQQLSNAPAELKLAADGGRSARTTQDAERESATLSADRCNRLAEWCQEHGITRSSFFLAAWSIVLSLHGGDDTVVVGCPVTLRVFPDESSVVGPLLHVVALPIGLNWGAGFASHARAVQQQMSAAMDNARVPFDRVVQMLRPSRDPSRNPIYQASFSYHAAVTDNAARIHSGSRIQSKISVLPTFAGGVTGDLALTVDETSDGLELSLDTATEVILPQRRRRLLAHLLHVIDVATECPDDDLADLELLPSAERREVMLQLNRGGSRALKQETILDAIDRQSALRPNAPAYEGPWGAVSYAELQVRSNRLAETLRHHGVGRGDYVPVMVSHGRPDVAVAIAAIWKAGAAPVPLDSCWPTALIEQACEDSAAKVVVDDTLACLPSSNSRKTRAARGAGTVGQTGTRPRLDDPIYAIYTSGSTGFPKAAVASHCGIVNRFAWMSAFSHADLCPPTTLQTTPATYDSSIWQLFWPLTHGGRCIIPEPASILDANGIADLIARAGVDVLDLVPSVATALAPELERSAVLRQRLAGIRWLILGGEMLTPQLGTRFRQLLPNARITNLYGPTEASIGCIFYELEDRIGFRVPIGRPIFNTQVALLDARGRPTPRGAVGELCLLGSCVGLGYLRSGTAHEFGRCSLPEFPGLPMYRTGDAARWNEGGYLEFHGRLDAQIKVRGHRIEPEGVEAVVQTHPSVERAAIALAPSERPDMPARLCLLVELKPGAKLDDPAFRVWLRGNLPASHLPDSIEILSQLPITKAGKLDRTALPIAREPAVESSRLTAAVSETSTVTEAAARRAWARTLGTQPELLSKDTNFFDAGGHSFLLLVLRSELNHECGVDLGILDLFKAPTIRAQARAIDRIVATATEGQEASSQ